MTVDQRQRGPDRTSHPLALEVLRGVAEAVGSEPDLRVACSLVAEAVRSGRPTRDVYVYLYDTAGDDLLLVGATQSPAAREVGTLRVAHGDGVTGWAAASRESYLVPDDPAGDPHFMPYPGIGEERYAAIFSVPVVSASDELVGCITVWAMRGDRFTADEVTLVEDVAALVAAPLERARLLDEVALLTRSSSITHELGALVAARAPVAAVVDRAAALALEGLDADLVVAVVTDPSGADRMVVASPSGTDPDRRTPTALVRRTLLEIGQDLRRGRTTWQVAAERTERTLTDGGRAVETIAVRSGADELGRLVVRPGRSRPSPTPPGLLAAVAGLVATALRLALALDRLEDRNGLVWFLRDVAADRLGPDELRRGAEDLGLDRAAAHVFVVVGPTGPAGPTTTPPHLSATPSEADLATVLARVGGLPAGTLTGATPHQAIAVVPWPSTTASLEPLRRSLLRVCASARSSTGTALAIGMSRPAASVDDFGSALAEAREAMSVGATMPRPSGVFTLDDVGHQLLLSRVSAVAGVRDRYAVAVARLVEYDRVKGTELLSTVATYLHLRSRSAAARELVVHRNTLGQRLARAGEVCGIEVCAPEEWFPLQLAIKVHLTRGATVPGG